MIEDRVGEVRIRVRTDLPDAAAIRPAAERIVRAVLERCAVLLEERAPGRVVLIRRLPLRWRLDESVFDDATQVDELAQTAADAIERIAVPSALDRPATSEAAVLFDDEAHLRASHLLAIARARPAWFHAALEEPEAANPLAALAAPQHRATAQATLARLAVAGMLAEVLAAQPAAAVAVLAAALGFDHLPLPSTNGAETGWNSTDSAMVGHPRIADLAAIASQWPALTPAARGLALRIHAAVLLDIDVDARDAGALAAALAGVADLARAPRPEAARIVAEDHPPLMAAAAPEQAAVFVTTCCAGLFYLLDRVQELDLAELLWQACLPEGAVLAAAAAALLGPRFAGDAAPALFGGVDAVLGCPEVTAEQHAEVASATCAALAAALPRRGLADILPTVVTLVDHPAGRLLVAAAEGSPFAFFAWPAAAPETLRAGLRAFLDIWPHHAALTAAPGLAGLDTSGRLRPHRDAKLNALLLPEAVSAPAAALLTLVAGAPCMLFAARAGAPVPDTVEAFVARHLSRAARIRIGLESMDVILGADDVDLEARRAGLDRDPGWVTWLRRAVRFVFQEREPPTAPPFAQD